MGHGIVAALEHIDRQNDDFAKRLESLVGLLEAEMDKENLYGKNIDGNPFVKKIEKAIYERLGLTVTFKTCTENIAAILPFYSNKNHIFLADFFRGRLNIKDQNAVLKQAGDKKGTVNLKRAEVTGIFSEYNHSLYLNFTALFKTHGMSSAEVTAVILHELGHAFNACYYSDRTDTTNQVLASINQRLLDRRGSDDIEYVYQEVSKITDSVKKEEIDRFLNGNRIIAGTAWFKIVVGIIRSQMKNDKYSETSFEELSDSFASRFGYGKQLVIGLDKLYEGALEKSPVAMKFVYLLQFITVAAFASVIAITITSTAAFGTGLILAVLSFFNVYVSGEAYQNYTYDELKDRYVRVRQDLIEQLKTKSLDKVAVKQLLESIYTVDEVVKTITPYKSILNRLSNLLFSTNRDALASIEAQKLMETLASNDLFVAAAELKV